jgi:hypothetical protein
MSSAMTISGVFQRDFHALGVGDEVGREVAAIELHALDDLERGLETLGLLDRDHAVLADLFHGLRDDLADHLVVVGRDRADLGDHLAGDRPRELLDRGHGGFHGAVDAALDVHRVAAGRHGLDAFPEDGLAQHRGGRRTVTGDVRGLAGHFAQELRAHVFLRVLEIDLFGHGHAVLCGQRGTEFLLQDDVAALGAQGDLDGVRQLVHAAEHRVTRVLGIGNVLR